ncbi:C40 family peptidase [Paenibacillus aurantius]|uniref:C40 family peptidase n=1 Tax=Paenibacillus aurantius TaxID=2918900 RepID=A0AA96REE7_9BACL|nr:C40 family peptidase [Paenibacillus aurantius]WNQ10078.1 C40 family peptidase [Paenibacillus aurantius]
MTASILALSLLFSAAGMASASPTGDKIASTAKSYVGKVKYRWGVRDPRHLIFDCSSFTQFIYQRNGVHIGWGANAQTKYGKSVYSKSKLQKGDLVMLSTSRPGKIGHVGIYVGNGKFVHAIQSGSVVSDLYSGYWKNRFVKGTHVK